MSDDSSDCSDMNFQNFRQKNRLDQKRNRRIVMRIEFDDSDESTSASDRSSDDDEEDVKNKKGDNDGRGNDLGDDGPSCSQNLRNRQKNKSINNNAGNNFDDSDDFQLNAAARRSRRGSRRINVLDVGFSDGSSSGSEVTRQKKPRGKKYIFSEDERESKSPSKNCKTIDSSEQNQKDMDEQGFTSDSSSNDLLEKCPICLLTFRQQEIGSPSTCEHIFCANCIEAWSRNVQTCPIDRIEFQNIIVRESFENRNIVREINVDPNAKKELALEDEIVGEEDVTNCEICNRPDREDIMLLCDHCNQGYHMDCLSPPLSEVPEGSWYCDNCVDSQEEEEDEDLHMLYEDIRDMGIPESRLRVREVHQPRILRTRQNERIRAAIIRRTRSVFQRVEATTTSSTNISSTTQRGRTRTLTTTASRRSAASTKRSVSGKSKRKTYKRRNRRARQRTYVVEYDLNNFDEKFAIKTTKKVIKRRKCGKKPRTSSKKGRKISADRVRMTASRRLAEQMGVKRDPKFTSRLSGSVGGLSLFGGANDLEYFSDVDNDDDIESEIHIETGHGTAVQTSVRISNYGSQRSRKELLLGRQPNRGIQEPSINQNNSNPDILSSILNMQDRWHSAARNLERVHINSDGTLNLQNVNGTSSGNTSSTPITPPKENNSESKETANGPRSSDINQAPMYSRGGGNTNFNNSRGGGGGGGYNNRSNNNQNSYRGGSGGGGNQYRHSTGGFSGSNAGSSGGIMFNMVGRGNFNFSNNPNYNPPPNQQTNASPFQQRNYNQRNLQNQQQNQNNQRHNNQQRHSLPFSINRNDNSHQQQQLQPTQNQMNSFGGGIPQTCLPPPSHLLLNQQPQQNLQSPLSENSLFAGLPPPMSIPPPHMNVAPPVRMSVPPPPAPPPVVIPPPVNNSLFQLNTDYGNNDDDSNCPNFSIYSHESLQVAKSSETYPNPSEGDSNIASMTKEDDGNEDLVQLDDDDEIPMPPDPEPTENVGLSELYEPENPTEENDDEDDDNEENNNENHANENVVKSATKDDGDDYDDDGSDSDDDNDKKNKDKEQQKLVDSEKYDPEKDVVSECSNNNEKDDLIENDKAEKLSEKEIDKLPETVRSPSPAASDLRLPEIETASSNRKGVLELYDDSDWEELDIDRPKEFQNKVIEQSNEKENIVENGNEDNENVNEQDRSYTPCLDENIDPEEHEIEGGSTTPLIENNTFANGKEVEEANPNIENMGTELISEEEEEIVRTNKERKKSQKNVDKRSDRRENEKVETFKKIGGKQKGRNYRGDKQPMSSNRRGAKKRRSRSFSRSRSADSFRSRFGGSRSRSPRFRGRSDRSRSRSRSNNKENQGRWGGNFRDGGRLNRNNSLDQLNRLKRRELPRYNVRNVVRHHSPPKNIVKDRYGRDTSRNRRSSRSLSRGRRGPPPRSPFSRSRSRNRRLTISLSPSPSFNRRRSMSPRPMRQFSPPRRRSTSAGRRTPPYRRRSRSPLRVMRSRSLSRGSEFRVNGRKATRQLRGVSPVGNINRGRLRSRSVSMSPRYTPRLSRSRSKTPRPKGRKKKAKESRKKKPKRRITSVSPSPNRRISRQPDPFEIEKPPKKKKRRTSRAKSPLQDDHGWSPSPSPPPQPIVNNYEYQLDKNVSWTPPMQSPLMGVFRTNDVRSVSRASRKEKSKRNKKKKKGEKRRDVRKEKKRKRRTETPDPAPSKEVFASGNNILVSVSFNKETTSSQHNQQTIVTLPPNREDLLSTRRASVDRVISTSAPTKKRKEKRKKIDTKPIAIIDLERSPFQVEQEPTDIIVLTDSEETLEREQREHSHDRRRSESCPRDVDTESHRNQRSVVSGGQRGEKSPERLDTILEESYDLPQSGGPKTPPEPPVVKFNLLAKKQSKVRNPLHDEDDNLPSDTELNERQQQQQQENHRSDLDAMHVQSNQKIGPNTPPESGPCSPDAYDPFEPTKSPSISPRSPTPPPSQHDVSQNATCGENTGELRSNQKHTTGVDNEQRREQIPGLGGNIAQSASINPVELVMALINSKSVTNSLQDLANKSNESQHNNIGGGINSHDDSFRDKVDESNAITVLSNLLITSGNMQHIPSISSPTPPTKKPIPGLTKIGGSVGGSSSSGVNIRNGGGGTSNNADDSFNVNDIESPYSPGSADYEDLFEPPPEIIGNKRRSKRGGKPEVFDNLFGSSSPINLRIPSYTPSKKHKSIGTIGLPRKTRIKVGKSNDDKVYDDLPSSAVELHVKDKFLRKLNRQERVVEEVKLVLKPRFNRKQISKEDYKEIMRRAVPKICHSRSGEIDPFKIKKLIEAYVKKFRAKHKKLNLVNTGQVSSAVKCAAYLKKFFSS